MSVLLAVLGAIAAVSLAVVAWVRLRPDLHVERPPPMGLQGRTDQWLLEAPALLPRGPVPDRSEGPLAWYRAAVVHREGAEARVPPDAALERLRDRASTTGRLLLEGHEHAACRRHARRHYHGPDRLFLAWYYAVALPRHGHRRILLDAIATALTEDP